MNLVLLGADEVDAAGTARLADDDRRARHLREVLRVTVGQVLRVGLLDGPLGIATITRTDPRLELACTFEPTAPPRPADALILAIGRPKVLGRCVEHAAALGFGSILLTRTWHTDKSHVQASLLALPELHARARLGLEQAQRTHLPRIEVFPLFRPFVEDRLAALCHGDNRVVAHPGADRDIAELPGVAAAPMTLTLGPERGFTPFELELLGAQGFLALRAGPYPLRVETALAWVYGQLTLLRARSRG